MENISTLNSQSSLQLSKTIQDFALAADFGSVLVDIHGKETSDLYNFSPFVRLCVRSQSLNLFAKNVMHLEALKPQKMVTLVFIVAMLDLQISHYLLFAIIN